jgi:hypothetical protein
VEIASLLDEMIEIVRRDGYLDKAEWLESCRGVIVSHQSSPDSIRSTLDGLHGVVGGMGGLMDLPISARSARERLDQLAEQLFDLTT